MEEHGKGRDTGETDHFKVHVVRVDCVTLDYSSVAWLVTWGMIHDKRMEGVKGVLVTDRNVRHDVD